MSDPPAGASKGTARGATAFGRFMSHKGPFGALRQWAAARKQPLTVLACFSVLCAAGALGLVSGQLLADISGCAGIESAVCAGLAARAWFKAGSAPAPWVAMPGPEEPEAWRAYMDDYAAMAAAAPFNRIGAIWAGWAAVFGAVAALSQAAPALAHLVGRVAGFG